jgi:hypothetical protein
MEMGREALAEYVESRDIVIFALEGADHRIDDHLGVCANVFGVRENLQIFDPVCVVNIVETAARMDQHLGGGRLNSGFFAVNFAKMPNIFSVCSQISRSVIAGTPMSLNIAAWLRGSPPQ